MVAVINIRDAAPCGWLIGTDLADVVEQCRTHIDEDIQALGEILRHFRHAGPGKHQVAENTWLLIG